MPAGFGSGKIRFWNPEMIPFQMIYVRKCGNSGLGGLRLAVAVLNKYIYYLINMMPLGSFSYSNYLCDCY